MRVVSQALLHRRGSHSGDIDVPAIDEVATGRVDCEAVATGLSINDLHFREAYPLLIAGSGRYAGHHHELDQLLGLERQLFPLGLFQPVFGGRDMLVCEGLEELDGKAPGQRVAHTSAQPHIQFVACPAKTPSPWPCPRRGSCGHGGRR